MKVTRKMMNKDIRVMGEMIRKIYKFRKESQFRACNKILNRFFKGRFPKSICVEERYIERTDGTKMRILICFSSKKEDFSTGVLWLHGGGYALGIPEQEFNYVKPIIKNTNSVVILPDYTLSVAKPFPTALEDCYLALKWMKKHSKDLGINSDQLFVAGESAGGGLTAALTIYARDKKEVNIAFQMPLYPMLDCRLKSPSMLENDAPVWDFKANLLAWKLYLGSLFDSENISPYASPSLEKDYRNLPSAYTFVGSIEPFYDETLEYFKNLQNAGVNAKIDVYEGCFHAFDLFSSKKKIGKQAKKKWIKEFKYATENYFAKQED